ncbi:Ig-like domain-containing protein [Pedobacter deserti]|uniref:Ig-like domain-containing protein n=1 Tax=Pedobacter deserti TaxID=2817382 RepID=UPI00210D9D3B|nr:tandem-95 repeat protein [Pedobacter sp. SYSU D00382]
MIKFLRLNIFFLGLCLFANQTFAQFPYLESFRRSTAPGITFGGAPSAFLTAGGSGLDIATQTHTGNPLDPDGDGYLRLTNNTRNQKGYIYSNSNFPSSNGLKVELEYYVYGGSGADGISFFLFDATANPFVIGGFGGSLGYAQITTTTPISPGVSKGYLAIGLDEYGNFSNNTEGRQGGLPGTRPGSVTLRGKGDGAALEPNNYKFLTTVQTSTMPSNPFSLVGNASSRQSNPTSPGYRRVKIDLAPDAVVGYRVTVKIVRGGSPAIETTVIDNYHYTEPAPPLLRYGLASSTGNQTNYHEIRNVDIDVFDDASLVAPTANDDVLTSCSSNSAIVNVVSNDVTNNTNGAINVASIDLNPAQSGIQTTYTVPGRGVFTLTSNGIVEFVPDAPFVGTVEANYTVRDNYGKLSNSAKVTVNYVTAPTAPDAGPDQVLIASLTPQSYVMRANAAISGTGRWSQISGPTVATFVNQNQNNTTVGNLTAGTYIFRWTISSGAGCDLADDVQIVVNSAPVANDDSYRTNLNTAVEMSVLSNDIDADGNTTLNLGSIVIKSPPQHGTLQINNTTGVITYTPTNNYSGNDTFTYSVKDINGTESNNATVNVAINAKPIGSPDIATTLAGSPITVPVQDNDLDKTGVTVTRGADPVNGTITINPNGTISYTPQTGFSGKDSFTYILRNGTGVTSDPITVTVNVRPVGSTDNIATNSNTAVTIPVKANDASSAGTTVVPGTTQPAHGSVVINSSGQPLYTPATGYAGLDNFTYFLQTADGLQSDPILVNVTVKPVGSADNVTTLRDNAVTIPVKDNDLNKTGTTVLVNANPTRGTVTVTPTGEIRYTPQAGYIGTDVFTYVLRTADAVESDPITVNVTINPAIPAPDITIDAPTGTPTVIDVPIPPGGKVIITVPPKNGTITFDPVTGKPIYTPNPGYTGPDDFTYVIEDEDGYQSPPGKVTLTVKRAARIGLAKALISTVANQDGSFRLIYLFTMVNYGDVAINNLSLIDNLATAFPGRTVTVNRINGSGTLRTNANYNGNTATQLLLNTSTLAANFKEQVELEITVSGNQQTGTYTNSATAQGQSADNGATTTDVSTTGLTPDPTTPGDVSPSDPTVAVLLFAPSLNIPVSTDDDVIINIPIPTGGSFVITNPPTNGTISIDPATGRPIYTPNPGYSGPDEFTYVIVDANGNQSPPATVTLTVTAPAKIGLAKAMVSTTKNADGSYSVRYRFTMVNYGDVTVNNVGLFDNLSLAFTDATYQIVNITTSGTSTLRINQAYNGNSVTNMLLPASTLAGLTKETVDMEVRVVLNKQEGLFNNFATVEGISAGDGSQVSDQSTNGFNPDPITAGDVSPSVLTPVTLTKLDLKIPGGFSPNNDGINDFFVIENALGKRVSLEVFNRWGNRIYRSTDYQNNWNGKTTEGLYVGDDVPPGTYYYVIILDGKDRKVGYITINR